MRSLRREQSCGYFKLVLDLLEVGKGFKVLLCLTNLLSWLICTFSVKPLLMNLCAGIALLFLSLRKKYAQASRLAGCLKLKAQGESDLTT